MRPNKFTVDQIIRIIAETELPDSSISSIARKYGVNPNTISKWKQKYKGLSSSDLILGASQRLCDILF